MDGLSRPRRDSADARSRCRRSRSKRSITFGRGTTAKLLFPNSRGGHLDFRNFNRRHWKPVQKTLGIEPLRDLYDLRHTYATFALRAGVPVFALSRFMGTSIAMIDLHYGHLAIDSYQHAVSLLDALALERAVDAGWTPTRTTAKPQGETVSRARGRSSQRAVDARWTSRREAVTTSAVRRG
jgi:integrase